MVAKLPPGLTRVMVGKSNEQSIPHPATCPTMSILRRLARADFLTPEKRLEWYPPFWVMRIKVLELAPDWRRIRIRLPLYSLSKNPGGSMFGGNQASLADPIPALACARIFPGRAVWTRAFTIEFQRPGDTDLELRFEVSESRIEAIRRELDARGRATPRFEFGFYLTSGEECSRIVNSVAIRPAGYSPPAGSTEMARRG